MNCPMNKYNVTGFIYEEYLRIFEVTTFYDVFKVILSDDVKWMCFI